MAYSVNASIACVIFFFILAWLSGLLRCYVRLFMVKKFGIDDWLALGSLLLLVATATAYLVGLYHYGLDRPISLAHGTEGLVKAAATIYFSELFYIPGTGLIKISFGFTLLRFLQDRAKIVVTIIVMAASGILSIIIFFVFLFNCSPVSYSWTRARDPYYEATSVGLDPKTLGYKPRGKCISELEVIHWNYVHASFMILADLTLGIIIPILVMKKLRMERSLKITTCAVLSLGALASAATITRFLYNHRLAKMTTFDQGSANVSKEVDFLIATNPSMFWTNIEYSLCVVGANCSTLKPLAMKIRLIGDSDAPDSNAKPPTLGSPSGRGLPQLNSWVTTSNTTDADPERDDAHHQRTGKQAEHAEKGMVDLEK